MLVRLDERPAPAFEAAQEQTSSARWRKLPSVCGPVSAVYSRPRLRMGMHSFGLRTRARLVRDGPIGYQSSLRGVGTSHLGGTSHPGGMCMLLAFVCMWSEALTGMLAFSRWEDAAGAVLGLPVWRQRFALSLDAEGRLLCVRFGRSAPSGGDVRASSLRPPGPVALAGRFRVARGLEQFGSKDGARLSPRAFARCFPGGVDSALGAEVGAERAEAERR